MITQEWKSMPVDALVPYERNARHNDAAVADVKESIVQCGNNDPIEIDENNVILSGHTRLKALQELGIKETNVVQYFGMTEAQKKKYRLLANKTAEVATWDCDLLAWELEGLDFEGYDFGFNLPADDKTPVDVTEDDYDAEPPADPRTKRGQIWQLGRHRLMCGDSTNADDVALLMGGAKADMVFTDPPYNMNYCGAGFINQENKNVKERIKDIIDFDAKSISYLATNKIANNVFIFTSKDLIRDYFDIFSGWKFNILVWHKTNTPPMVNNNYFADTEYCLYFHNGKRVWNNGLKPIDIYKKYYVSGMHEGRKGVGDLHPTMKPLVFIGNQVKICSTENGIVVDIFGGSGSTLIACEQLNRICYTMEIEPKYVDIIIDRWEQLTGNHAELVYGEL